MVKKKFLLIFFLFCNSLLYSQSRQDLQKIQQEIHQLQEKLKNSQTKLQATIQLVQSYDKKILIFNKSIRRLEEQIREESEKLDSIQNAQKFNQEKILQIKRVIKEQSRLIYMKNIINNQNDVLSLFNISSSFRYRQYIHFLLQYELELIHKYNQILSFQKNLEQRQKNTLISLNLKKKELSKQKEKLLADKKSQEKLIAKIKSNRKYMQAALKEKSRSYEKLKKMLKSLQAKNKKANSPLNENRAWMALKGKFHELKGKLNWPVQGNVLHKFGKIVKKEHGRIVLMNNGIDIKAPKGTQVRAVHDGVVTMISYIGLYGNVVIIDHNDGYVSVYCNLEDYFVNKGQYVKSGDVIGKIGESLEGPILHFEIWANDSPVNPQKWLHKN